MSKKVTTIDFIECAKKIHGSTYDYSLVEYKNMKSKVDIICPKHGIFQQAPTHHLNNRNCPSCYTITTEDFIQKAKLIHGDVYDYSLVNYKNSFTKIKIICSVHGIFKQTPHNHTTNKTICPDCSADNKRKSINQFIIEANKMHNNIYDYSLVNYKNNKTSIKIICKKHGVFEQIPTTHLCGCGCPICNTSKGELQIYNYLKENDISFISEHKFGDCKYKSELSFDFYLPEYNLCIEYDGIQHFKFIKGFTTKKEFKLTQIRDNIKTNYCKNNNIELIRIKYNENIFDKLSIIPNS